MLLNRYEWIQFYILYFVASVIEYIEKTHKSKHLLFIQSLNTLSETFVYNKSD